MGLSGGSLVGTLCFFSAESLPTLSALCSGGCVLLLVSAERCMRFWQSVHDMRNLVTASRGRNEYISAIYNTIIVGLYTQPPLGYFVPMHFQGFRPTCTITNQCNKNYDLNEMWCVYQFAIRIGFWCLLEFPIRVSNFREWLFISLCGDTFSALSAGTSPGACQFDGALN